ncbi:uncharacterized protein LOC120260023 [Dioscorea cayenensis subsp. rotundata]|uniref:Uncharacterized protein LOC120260023 n=1 Tax=Dioscorea cayennensis subsp. rotundata TaxID=55577 RepID=A0AB40B8U6_DIOCR|nr:uncharacterized protein LOC120260023 [Dioscorea cayenensis subsp. rotundata]
MGILFINIQILYTPQPRHGPLNYGEWDVDNPIELSSSLGHRFILAAIDYFSRWAEAILLREVKTENILRFFKENILYRFGTLRRIISDNGTPFRSFKVGRCYGLAKAFNKTLSKLLKKAVSRSKRIGMKDSRRCYGHITLPIGL